MNNFNFVVRYIVIPSRAVYNECGPNPIRFGGEEGTRKMIDNRNSKDNFYVKLEESILKDGFRNPILISAGWCPETKLIYIPKEMQNDHSKILVCDRHGGSRLYIAQKHNLHIPCIVSDFCGMFEGQGKVLTKNHEMMECFKDKPTRILVNAHGVHVKNLPQIHMDGVSK